MLSREEQVQRTQAARVPKAKPPAKSIKPISEKKAKQMAEEKKLRGGEDTLKEQWFKARRKEMTGTCGCGCGEPSQKNDDLYFRHSAAHVFPKSLFPSVMYHPKNCVERRFWGGHHTNMDEQGLDKWPNMADWDKIKEIFHELAPLLTAEERGTKFYSILEKLIYAN